MRYGYVRVKKETEVIAFEGMVTVDSLFVDVVSKGTDETGAQLDDMLSIVSLGDTIVLLSLDNAFNNFEEMQSFFSKVTFYELKLEVLAPSKETATSSFTYLADIVSLAAGSDGKTTVNRFPDHFYPVFKNYSNGSISWKMACEVLGLSVTKFYALVNLFKGEL